MEIRIHMLARNNTISVSESQSILDMLQLISFDTWVVLDIDNTVMEPQFELGSDQWFTKLIEHACSLSPNNTIDAVTSVIAIYQAVQHHVSTKPVESQVVFLINALQDSGIPLLALTARDGTLIETTCRQLNEIGIDFSRKLTSYDSSIQLGTHENNRSIFQGNIIFCGGNDKGQCLKELLKRYQILPRHIVMVDDKEKHLMHVKEAVLSLGIRFNGLRYSFLDNKVKMLDMQRAHVQLTHLKNKLPNHVQTMISELKLSVEVDAPNLTQHSETFSNTVLKNLKKRKLPIATDIEHKRSQKTPNPLPFFLSRTNTKNAIAVYGDKETLFFGNAYVMLTHQTPFQPYAKLSCRGYNRETILIDCESSQLKKFFSEYLSVYYNTVNNESATQPLDKESIDMVLLDPYHVEVMTDLLNFIKKRFAVITEEELASLIQEKYNLHQPRAAENIIPLEWFLQHGVGFCRHQALATAYVLAQLVQYHAEKQGNSFHDKTSHIFRFRTQLQALDKVDKKVSHAMVVYQAANGHYYLLDSTRKTCLVVDLSELTPDAKQTLKESYYPFDSDLLVQQLTEAYSISAQVESVMSPFHR